MIKLYFLYQNKWKSHWYTYVNFPRCSMFEAPKLSPWLLVWLKIWRNSCKMIADLRNNQSFEWSMQVAHTCIESDWIQGSSMNSKSAIKKTNKQTNKQTSFLVPQRALENSYFWSSSLWSETIYLEANSETPNCRAAIFVFLIHQWLSVYKLAPGPLVLKKKPWIYLFSRAKIAQLKHNNHQMLKH